MFSQVIVKENRLLLRIDQVPNRAGGQDAWRMLYYKCKMVYIRFAILETDIVLL